MNVWAVEFELLLKDRQEIIFLIFFSEKKYMSVTFFGEEISPGDVSHTAPNDGNCFTLRVVISRNYRLLSFLFHCKNIDLDG